MRKIIFTFFAVLLSFSAIAGSGKASFKLITFNVRTSAAMRADGNNKWANRCDGALNMLNKEKPDVLGVQEAEIDQLQYFDAQCPQYARVGVGRDNGLEGGGETMAIFYLKDRFDLLGSGTFWLSETPDEVSRGWDAVCNRTVTWVELKDKASGRSFFYFNTHLDHQGRVAREESVKLIVSKIQSIAGKKSVVFLGGDFNSSLESLIFKPFAKAKLKSVPGDGNGTFNGFGTAPDTIVLDHIFCRGKAGYSSSVTLKGDYGVPYLSDHYPVSLVFTL
ncbi:MAG: endonuclease/exonuclease/phosphatase family protein [Bacteroidales bacterium]